MLTFIEANLVPQNDHSFGEQLVLKVLSKEGAQLSLQQLPAMVIITAHEWMLDMKRYAYSHTSSAYLLGNEPDVMSLQNAVFTEHQTQEMRKDAAHTAYITSGNFNKTFHS